MFNKAVGGYAGKLHCTSKSATYGVGSINTYYKWVATTPSNIVCRADLEALAEVVRAAEKESL